MAFASSLAGRAVWLGYRSTNARGEIWIARDPVQNSWLLAITHPGVVSEISLSRAEIANAPGHASYAFSKLANLYDALDRAYKLGVSLPDAPLEVFRKLTVNLPRSTEAERLTVVRVGQDVFRYALLEYWNSRCPLTDITDPGLLRASHIVPWAECESDDPRLDVHNGLLLSVLWDCAFDSGLISFSDTGTVLRSSRLSDAGALALQLDSVPSISQLRDSHRRNLARHRAKHAFQGD